MANNPLSSPGPDAGSPRFGPAQLPSPPADLAQRQLPLPTLAERVPVLYRSHRIDRSWSPVAFNSRPIADRFNAPNGEYGVLYLASDPFAAFIETFGASMVTAALELRLVSESDLARRCLCRIEVDADLATVQLVNLADGYGFSRLGIDGRISTTKQRHITRQWALELWRHPQQPSGILFRACNDQARLSIVLFDRVGDILRSTCEHNILRDARQLAAILDHYAIGLDPK
ncbi:RES family NAD+ phosphorylase [soil metagenome]